MSAITAGDTLPAESSVDTEPGAKPESISQRSFEFMKLYYPEISVGNWNNWKWQLANSFNDALELKTVMKITNDENVEINEKSHRLLVRITPYFASLIYDSDPLNPLRRNAIPNIEEFIEMPYEQTDPLHEQEHSPVKGIVHRYPDRVLFTVTQTCANYCRYCTRSHSVGNMEALKKSEFETAFEYISNHKEVRDVIVSGGDPLTLTDLTLDYILSNLRSIKHVEMIRIGTRVPVVLPQRITNSLITILKKYQPLYISLHFSHPDEITEECARACNMLADGGFPLGSQTVLLKGINDNIVTMEKLMHELLKIRVRPYYLYQCDLVPGSGQFRTTVKKGLEIMQALRGYTSGYAVPTFVVDAPGGGGKIPLLPEYVIEHNDTKIILKNYQGIVCEYPEI